MPYKNLEKRRQYDRQYKRRKRAKIKEHKAELREKEIDRHYRSGDLNFGIPCKKPKFMTYLEWKNHNPDGDFKAYLKQKREFDFSNRDYGEPLKIPNRLSESEKAYAQGIGLYSDKCAKLREQLKTATPKQAIFIEMLLEDNGC